MSNISNVDSRRMFYNGLDRPIANIQLRTPEEIAADRAQRMVATGLLRQVLADLTFEPRGFGKVPAHTGMCRPARDPQGAYFQPLYDKHLTMHVYHEDFAKVGEFTAVRFFGSADRSPHRTPNFWLPVVENRPVIAERDLAGLDNEQLITFGGLMHRFLDGMDEARGEQG